MHQQEKWIAMVRLCPSISPRLATTAGACAELDLLQTLAASLQGAERLECARLSPVTGPPIAIALEAEETGTVEAGAAGRKTAKYPQFSPDTAHRRSDCR